MPQSADIKALIDAMPHAVWLVDGRTTRIVAANVAAGRLLNCEAGGLVGQPAQSLAATPEDQSYWEAAAQSPEACGALKSDTLLRRFDGSVLPVTRSVERAAFGADDWYVVTVFDRSSQVAAERERETVAAELAATLESTADGILVTNLSGRVRQYNRRFAELWGLPEDLLVRRDDDALFEWMRRSVVDPANYMRRLAQLDEATLMQASDRIELHSGRIMERVASPQCSRGRPIGRVFCFRDMTDSVAAKERIERLSHTDGLTGLPNRSLLADRIDRALARSRREGVSFALLLLNIDRFKHINDTLGQTFGDRVLIEVAERLQACVRQIDTVSRLSSDEFVLLTQQTDATGAEATARRVTELMQRPFTLDGMSFTVTASIGIALHPSDGGSLDELLSHADAAMREVKQAGRNAYRFHTQGISPADALLRSRMKLDHAMRQALSQQQFRLHYQPQIDLRSGLVLGAEALIRWNDPEMGEISPAAFIPVAEESGFIIAIGDWVLRQAVTQAALWKARGMPTRVSVNVSALQFRQPSFVDSVANALRDANLAPEWLELELTESILLKDAEDTLARLHALHKLGVKLAIDDFGTGYSSLGYLKHLPIERLKIDRSFVRDLPDDRSDAGIVNAIINLGRALRMQVIAEGVETESQRDFLLRAGCDEFQGFLFAPALESSSFEALLAIESPAPKHDSLAATLRPGSGRLQPV